MKRTILLIVSFLSALVCFAQTPPSLNPVQMEAEQAILSGGARIMTDHSGFSGKGFVAGFDAIGASMGFKLTVPAPGMSKVAIRYSSGWGAQTVGLYIDGQKITDLRLVGTNGWNDWATTSSSVQLTAGNKVLELRRDRKDSGTVNFDWILLDLPPAPSLPPSAGVPQSGTINAVTYEAEEGRFGGSARIAFDHMSYSGKGFVAGFENAGASVAIPVSVPSTGLATLSIRYSAGWGDQTVGLYIDGKKAADIRAKGTPSWDDWATVSAEINLAGGSHEVEIRRDLKDSGAINIDKIQIEKQGVSPPSTTATMSTTTPLPPAMPPYTSVARLPSALPAAVSIEAELCVLSGSAKVETDHSGYTGLGFVAGFGDVGAAIRFMLPIRQAGPVTVELRYTAGFGDEVVGLYVDNAKQAELRCPRSPSWDAWAKASVSIPLNPGTHSIEIRRDRNDTGLINVDSIACY